MADDKHDPNQSKNMGTGNRGDQGGGQNAPGREANDDLSTGNRAGGSHMSPSENEFEREDRDREQPGSKQRDQGNR